MTDGFMKYPWLATARIDFIRGGFNSGSYGAHLIFSGRPLPATDAPAALSSLLKAPLPAFRYVRLSGQLPTTDPEFLLFVQALIHYGFQVQVVITPEQAGPWLDRVSWVTLRTESHILMFQPNEVWYEPTEVPIKEIIMPQIPGKITFTYMKNGLPTAETEKFFIESKYHWQLL